MTAAVPPRLLLELAGVSVRFPGAERATLESIDLTIAAGELVSIVGPSGCGKSTLLRVLAGLLPITTGTRDLGADAASLAAPGQIAMVFQEPRLLPWRTVWENMRLPFELVGQAADEAKMRELLELTGLQPSDFQKFPRMLSGGMRMRVAVARALALSPQLLLLDEPFAAVDDLLREQLNEELLRLQQRFGFAVVLVTHHLGEAVYLSQRLLVMSAQPGQIVAQETFPWPVPRPAQLREHPDYAIRCGEIRRMLRGQ